MNFLNTKYIELFYSILTIFDFKYRIKGKY